MLCNDNCRGLQPLSDQEVLKSYGGRHVRMEDISGFYGIVRACIVQCQCCFL